MLASRKKLLSLVFLLAFFSLNPILSHAIPYVVDSATGTPGGPVTFDTLNNLNNNSGGLFDGDSVRFNNSDGSLAQRMSSDAAGLSFSNGAGGPFTVSATGANSFLYMSNSANITWGGIVIKGFTNDIDGGGAVHVEGDLDNLDNVTFIGNKSTAVDTINYGAAVYVGGSLIGGIHNAVFSDNGTNPQDVSVFGVVYLAGDLNGGIADSKFTGAKSGTNVYMEGSLTGGVSNSIFSGNLSGGLAVQGDLSGGINNSTFSDNEDGALYVNGSLDKIVNSTLSNNSSAGNGGALVVHGDIGDIAGVTFKNNSSHYWGGALYSTGNIHISSASFINNRAIGVDGDPLSGQGGAIVLNTSLGARAITLAPSGPGAIVFSGNTAAPGNSPATPSSIYFINSDSGSAHAATVNITTAAGSSILMQDSISSAPDNLISNDGGRFGSVLVNVNKNGPGLWALGGKSDMQSASHWTINEGTLKLVQARAGEPGTQADINLAHKDSSFTLKNGAVLEIVPSTQPSRISASRINLENGSKVGLAGFTYGAALPNNTRFMALKLNSPNLSNQSSISAKSGSITIGVNTYKYNNLTWLDPSTLTFEVGNAPLSRRDLTGASATTAPPAILIQSPFNKAWFERMDTRFGGFNPFNLSSAAPAGEAPGDDAFANQLWVRPLYSIADQQSGGDLSGYTIRTPGLAIGYDRAIGERAFMGLGLGLSRPDYQGGGVENRASEIALALYGGAILPLDLELSAFAGTSWYNYDQRRTLDDFFGETYNSEYGGRLYTLGLGLARAFALGDGFGLKPFATYEYMHLKVDGYDEGAGVHALTVDDNNLNLHRVRAGLEGIWQEERSGLKVSSQAYYLGLYGDRDSRVGAFFTNDPAGRANGFSSLGDTLDENNLGLGLNLSLPVNDRLSVGCGYGVLFGKTTISQEGMVTASIKF